MLIPGGPQSEKTLLSAGGGGGSSSLRDADEQEQSQPQSQPQSQSVGWKRDLPGSSSASSSSPPTSGIGGKGRAPARPTIEIDPPSNHGMNLPAFQSLGRAVDLATSNPSNNNFNLDHDHDFDAATSIHRSSSSQTAATDPPSTSRKHRATHVPPLHARARDRSKSKTSMPYSRSVGELTGPSSTWEDIGLKTDISRRGHRRSSDDTEEQLEDTDADDYGPLDNR
jgi:hypothetical protein